MHPTGRFERITETFSEGLCDLMDISFSIKQSIADGIDTAWMENNLEYPTKCVHDPEYPDFPIISPVWDKLTVRMVITALEANDIPEQCGITWSDGKSLAYITSGGLVFGWEYGTNYKFYIVHPVQACVPSESSLRKSTLEHGWAEVIVEG